MLPLLVFSISFAQQYTYLLSNFILIKKGFNVLKENTYTEFQII
jgi:hypothetical protein